MLSFTNQLIYTMTWWDILLYYCPLFANKEIWAQGYMSTEGESVSKSFLYDLEAHTLFILLKYPLTNKIFKLSICPQIIQILSWISWMTSLKNNHQENWFQKNLNWKGFNKIKFVYKMNCLISQLFSPNLNIHIYAYMHKWILYIYIKIIHTHLHTY